MQRINKRLLWGGILAILAITVPVANFMLQQGKQQPSPEKYPTEAILVADAPKEEVVTITPPPIAEAVVKEDPNDPALEARKRMLKEMGFGTGRGYAVSVEYQNGQTNGQSVTVSEKTN